MLTSFGLSLEEKHNLSKRMCKSMLKEFGYDEHNQKPLNERYRALRKDVANSVEGTFDKPIITAIEKYAQAISNTLDSCRYKDVNITSHIHMMNNRLFAAQGRFHEMMLYFCLSRLYESLLARILRYSSSTKPCVIRSSSSFKDMVAGRGSVPGRVTFISCSVTPTASTR